LHRQTPRWQICVSLLQHAPVMRSPPPALAVQQRVPRGQQNPRAGNPRRQNCCPFLQQTPCAWSPEASSFPPDAQYSSASQQVGGWPFAPGQGFWPGPQGQCSGVGPGLQPPLPSGCDFSRLHGSQQPSEIAQPFVGLFGPNEQTVCFGQQVARQMFEPCEQTL
jgi:hypothetical protein